MANFCSQCGRPLQEGEVCTCSQNTGNPVFQSEQTLVQNPMGNPANPQPGVSYAAASEQMANQVIGSGKNLFQKIPGLFKDPIETVKSIADENKMMAPMIMVIINIVIIYLLSVICMVSVRVKLGDYADWISIPYVRIVLSATILSAIYDFALAGALLLSTKVFFKEETTFAKMLAIVGCKVFLDSVFILVGALFMILNGTLGMMIISVGMLFTTIILIMSFQKISALPEAKKFYALFLAIVIQLAVMAIFYYAIGNSALSNITRAFNYIY